MVGFLVSLMLVVALVAWLKSYYRKTLTKVANDPKLWQEWVIKSKVTPEKQDEIQRKYGTGVIPLHTLSAPELEPSVGFELQISTQAPSPNIVHVNEYGYFQEYEEVPPMPWEQRQIFSGPEEQRYFVAWQGQGPETEFSLNRKRRVKIIPTKIMKGFDGKRYLCGLELPDGVETIYNKDDISSQLKSKGHSADDFWPWAHDVLGFDYYVMDSLTVDYDHTTFETLWEGEGPATEFTYRHDLDRDRVKIIPSKIERHRIDNTYCITGLQEGKAEPYRYFEKKILTMLKSEGMKRLHLQDWVNSFCVSETDSVS